jgi:hypothetical protein
MKPNDTFDRMLAAVRAGLYLQQQRAEAEARRRPSPSLVTISRQAGAGGLTLAYALADHLDATDPADRPWAVWDRELVEKIAQDEHIPVPLIDSFETGAPHRTLFQEFLASFSVKDSPEDLDEFQVYRRVAHTIRGLARAGRAIIVGRGGVYATQDLRGGVHLRLVAPLQDRVTHMARLMNVPEEQAAVEVRRIDKYRDAFHRRYWPDKALLPEIFTLTLNTAAMDEGQMVQCVLPLLPAAASPPRPQPAAAEEQAPAQTAGALTVGGA